ncbi:hypothetical protein HOS99_gp045 [Staphylococcus phage phiSA_BS1]|uniref:Uncharacterized protein n=2 Tax=Baoshanvirus TaxID=2732969 RepID=A0A2P1MXI9_9CAUD|nr:hypothetical protein HOS99_gp045 [Staphylococcus phage phiSA_BS1]YP_009799970.1 hypothetical protein HOT02_gp130 [Staphylococcus phage phiSA_BS2]AVP40299.1 hypothetical protein [Staphylococcus phage phiSA_BS1]AVR55574.1 hypothetical protein phiSABS2_130 [Staphylococcus phage phiSA_BS2]WFG34007.1 hypothetical protein F10086_85 [Staphylococcus phage vB_SauM_JDF86]
MEEREDILNYINRVIHGMIMKDKQEYEEILQEGKDINVTREELALVVTNLIRNIDTQMNDSREEVIEDFNIMIESMISSGVITEDTVGEMQNKIDELKKEGENE